jgi:hypothetical protein
MIPRWPPFAWCLVHALEAHALALVALGPGPARAPPPGVGVEVAVELAPPLEAPAPDSSDSTVKSGEGSGAGLGRARASARPWRGRGASAPAVASSALAANDGPPLVIGPAATFAGGITATDGTSLDSVDEFGGGGGSGGFGDLSRAARLGRNVSWACNANDVPGDSFSRVRVLVRPDGSAVRAEVLDGPPEVLRDVMGCALLEHYQPGRDCDGRAATKWTRPFRIVVVGHR